MLWSLYLAAFVLAVDRSASKQQVVIAGAVIFSVAMLGRAAVERLFPPRVDIEASSDSVTFLFRDLDLGYDFRALNPGARDTGGLTSA